MKAVIISTFRKLCYSTLNLKVTFFSNKHVTLKHFIFIQLVTSSQKIEPGTLCSTKGLDEITSENDCKAAGEKRGLQWGNSWNGPGGHPGCVYADDGRNKVYFNISPRPGRTKLNDKYSAICKGYL